MTDEEMAEEYVHNKADKGNFDLEQFGKAYFSESSMKQAFLAGLKTGRETESRFLRYWKIYYNPYAMLLETLDIIKCAECGNIIDLPKDQIKRYCLHQESNYRNCLCVSCSQKWKQTQEMANIKSSDLIYFGRKI